MAQGPIALNSDEKIDVCRKRMSAEDRRFSIIRAAMDVFARLGFKGTTTKEIAEASGISEAIIFRHFATKHDLYSAIIDYKVEQSREQLYGSMNEWTLARDDRLLFSKLGATILDHYRSDPAFIRLLLYSALEGHELAHMFFERQVMLTWKFLYDYILLRTREGVFREIDPMIAARAFLGMINHYALVRELFTEHQHDHFTAEQAIANFSDIFFEGIRRHDS